MNTDKINKLLEEMKIIASKLDAINDAMNATESDGEDMIPGHDEGAEYWAKMNNYKILLEQARNIRSELRKLGYNKI